MRLLLLKHHSSNLFSHLESAHQSSPLSCPLLTWQLYTLQARFRERQKAKQADTERRMAGLEAELQRLQVLAPSPNMANT